MAEDTDTQQDKKQDGPLGKGLSSLIASGSMDLTSKGFIPNLPVEHISPNPHQPRMTIKPEELIDIADSIRDNGIIQPLIVTKRGPKDYVLIAGERRWRAAQLADAKTVPVVIREASPQQMLEMAVIENIHRQDLNPIEEALAFQQLKEKFSLKHNDIGKKVGLSRVAVVNKIRLLNLPENVKRLVLDHVITEGHARALLGIDDDDSMVAAADVVVRKNLSVHQTEELVRKIMNSKNEKKTGRPRRLSQKALKWEEDLSNHLDTKLTIMKLKGGGKITIRYKTEKDLEKIYKKIVGK
jgi:ParB family transcriptional regulator, chromosome partitioning protein